MSHHLPTTHGALVSLDQNAPVTTSLIVAEAFEKQHKDVLRAIERLECSDDFRERNFALSLCHISLPKGGSKQQPLYQLTRDGFMFLSMGFTGSRAAQTKEAFIVEFGRMEAALRARETRSMSMEMATKLAHYTAKSPKTALLLRYVSLGLSMSETARLLQCTTNAVNHAA